MIWGQPSPLAEVRNELLVSLSSANFHKGVQPGVNLFCPAEHAFGIKCYFNRHSLGRINKCKQGEKKGHSSGTAACNRINIHNFAVECVLFKCLDSDRNPLTQLNAFRLIFIEMCNHPRVVSD